MIAVFASPWRRRASARRGFTLVELVLSLAILALILTTLMFMRINAVDKVTEVVEERELRRLAQELLAEKIADFPGDEPGEIWGTFAINRQEWQWEWENPLDPANVIQEGEEFLLACTLRLSRMDPQNELNDKSYELTTWITPTELHLEVLREQQALIDEGEFLDGTGLGYDY